MEWTLINTTPRTIRLPSVREPSVPQNVEFRHWPNSLGNTPSDAVGKQIKVSDGTSAVLCVVSAVDDRGRLMLAKMGAFS